MTEADNNTSRKIKEGEIKTPEIENNDLRTLHSLLMEKTFGEEGSEPSGEQITPIASIDRKSGKKHFVFEHEGQQHGVFFAHEPSMATNEITWFIGISPLDEKQLEHEGIALQGIMIMSGTSKVDGAFIVGTNRFSGYTLDDKKIKMIKVAIEKIQSGDTTNDWKEIRGGTSLKQ